MTKTRRLFVATMKDLSLIETKGQAGILAKEMSWNELHRLGKRLHEVSGYVEQARVDRAVMDRFPTETRKENE